MDATSHDAQREMQQRSLRNVRALLDKLEAEERDKRTSLVRELVIVGVIVLVLAVVGGAMFLYVQHAKEERRKAYKPPAAFKAESYSVPSRQQSGQ